MFGYESCEDSDEGHYSDEESGSGGGDVDVDDEDDSGGLLVGSDIEDSAEES